MAKIRTLQIYRGTTAQNDAYTGSAGELTMDTTTNELRLHDGSTVGGHIIGAGSSGAVDSVNGKTGVVVLTATDVGALPDSTVIPDAQIQSDWNQADNTKVDFIKNKPTIPAAQVNSDWNANSGVAQILNKPTLATVATSGSYNDLLNKPTIPTVNDATIIITQGGVTKGSFTLNQSSGETIALDAGGGGSLPSQTGHAGEFLTTDGTDASWAEITDYIVEKQDPTAGNNYTWYRKYKSGWVEQGGVITNSSGTASVTIPVEMSDTNYTVLIGDGVFAYANVDIRVRYVQSKTTTGFTTSSASGISFIWQVSGVAAS